MRLRRYAAAAGRRLAAEDGYSLIELIVVLAILLIIVTALTQLFVSASTAQVDMTRRFEAQQDMRLALDKLRREIHCASDATANNGAPLVATTANPASAVRFALPGYCPTNPTPDLTPNTVYVTWCTAPVAGSSDRYKLWRYVTTNVATGPTTFVTSCGSTVTDTSKQQWGDYLRLGPVFAPYTAASGGNLGTLGVNLDVDLTPGDAKQRYVLKDDIVLRNTLRS
jgi:prepilin-type N-terminal cleavage/methylation domain-containing protein